MTTRSIQMEDTRPWYRQFWPWFLIAIPACTVIGCLVTIALAVQTREPVLTEQPCCVDESGTVDAGGTANR